MSDGRWVNPETGAVRYIPTEEADGPPRAPETAVEPADEPSLAPEPPSGLRRILRRVGPVAEQPIVAFAADVLGIVLHPKQAEILSELYAAGPRVALLRLGRRSGKGLMASIVATYEATVRAAQHRRHARPSERQSKGIDGLWGNFVGE